MAYKINGVIRLADNGDANLGFVTATDVNAGTGSVTAAELYGKVSKEAITEQTEGDETNITGADEVLIYDQETDSLLRVTVDEFVVGSGIGTLVENFDHVHAGSLVVTGVSTLGILSSTDTLVGGALTVTTDLYIVGDIKEVVNINASGIVTAPTLETNSINPSGDDVVIGGGVTVGAGLTVGEDLKVFGNAEVSGIVSMTGGIDISGTIEVSGIITSAPGGIVTYYGDHGNITNLSPASIVSTVEPTERATGEPLQEGDLWFFSGAGDGQLRQYTYTQGAFKDSNPQVAIPPLNFDADDGSSSIGIASEVLSVKGVDNIETVAAGTTITVGLSSNVSIAGTMTAVAYYGDGSFLTGLGTEGVSDKHIFPSDVTTNNLTVRELSSTRNLYVSGVSTFEGPITGAAGLTTALSVVANDDTKLIRANQASNTAEGVELYYADDLKFQTVSTGASVVGNMHADTFTGDGSGLTDVISTAEDVAIGSTVIEPDPQYITFVEGQSGVHTVRTETRLNYTPNTGILSTPAVQSSYIKAKSGEDLTIETDPNKAVLIEYNTDISGGLNVTGVTTTGIITASGSATFTDGVFLPDNSTLGIGSTSPFTINHDGTDTVVRNTTGDLDIRISDDDQVAIQRDATNAPIAEFNPEADVKLYYAGGERIRTTPDGVLVSGAVTATGTFYGDASGLINAPINGIVTDLAADRYYAALGIDVGILTAVDAEIDDLVVNNTVVADAFVGNGSSITNLDASELTSGTIPDDRFPSTLPSGDGSNITNLNADNLSSGTVPTDRLTGTYDIDISGNAATADNAINSGAATTATKVSVTNVTDDVWRPVAFVDDTTAGDKDIRVDTGTEAAINPNTNQFRATSFLGDLTGDVTGDLTGDVTGNVSGNAGTVTNGVYTEGNQTINGTKTFSSTITGSISGNAGSSDNAQVDHDTGNAWHRPVFIDTGAGSGTNQRLKTDSSNTIGINPSADEIRATNFKASGSFIGNVSGNVTGNITGDLTGNADTVTNGVYTEGNQTINGTKTFSSTISGSINGNSATVTNGVYTEGDQTINGTKTFTSSISGTINRAVRSDSAQIEHDTGNNWHRPVFVDANFTTNSYIQLRSDNEEVIGINPSTNEIRATSFLGNLTGTASNADTLDNINSTGFLRSNASDQYDGQTAGRVMRFRCVDGRNAGSTSGSLFPLEIYQNTNSANSDAAMAFHISGAYATYFGLDKETNDLFVGGWSKGATKNKIWHAGNDGSGSGLDADTLDGLQGSSFLRSNAADNIDGDLTVNSGEIRSFASTASAAAGKLRFGRDTAQYFSFWGDAGGNVFQSISSSSNPKAGIRFAASVNGGSSSGNTWTLSGNTGTIWHSGNDGANSGLDADTLDGQQLVGTDATANTVVGRNGSRDIFVRLVRSDYQNQSTISGAMAFRVNNGTDDYIRFCNSTSAIRTYLSVPQTNGTGATGDWPISITGASNSIQITETTADQYYRILFAGSTGNSQRVRADSNTTIGINPSTNRIRASLFEGSLDGNASSASIASVATSADESDRSLIQHDTGNAWHRIVMVDDGLSNNSQTILKSDNASTIGINPSSNTIRATTFSGNLSGGGTFSGTCTGSMNGTLSNASFRNAQVQLPFGSRGTYVFAGSSINSTTAGGTQTSGGNLRASNASGENDSTSRGGNWRLMGYLGGGTSDFVENKTSLWLRYE